MTFELVKENSEKPKISQRGQPNPSARFQIVANKPEESGLKSAARTALQVPQGIAEATPYGIGSSLFQLAALGESDLSVEEFRNLRKAYEERGETFDEEAYERGRQEMLASIPTVSNIARKVEEKTGIPLEPKTRAQKGLRFASTAGKLAPKDYTLRGMNTSLPRPVLGAAVEGVREALLEAGLPQEVADIASFAILKKPTEGAGKVGFGVKEKPSGLPERGFESLTKKREVPESKIQKINEKLSDDFKKVSEKIVKDSPIGETAKNLASDPTFKQASRELLDQAQTIANKTPGTLPTMRYKEALLKQSQEQMKGFALNEYKKNYLKYTKEAIEDVLPENMTYGELVEQYRENNRALGEYFEPGSSKAVNRAKKDSLLDQNRAIAFVIEESHPELSQVFKEGNARWTKIMDAEAVDTFVNDMFKEGKPDFKKMHDFFDKNGYDRLFKRALGEDGYKAFEQAMKDMLETQVPYNMMKQAKERDVVDFFKKLVGFKINPKVGLAQVGWDVAKSTYRGLINAMLDKPKLALTFERAIKDAKKGDFKAAEQGFKTVQAEIEVAPKQPKGEPAKLIKEETIDVTPKKLEGQESQTKSFKTEKGSTYEVNEDGSTTRNKAYRSEHGSKDQGSQPKLIEYKPKPIEKQSLKERSESMARESFKDILEGKPISDLQRNKLKNTQVSILQTRGQGQQFHGSRKPINKLNSEIYDVSGDQNIYGPGFYTTDALDIADGYSKAKKSRTPTVYKVYEKTPQKIYDIEIPMSKEIKDKLKYYIDEYGQANTVREVYDNITDHGEGLPAYEVQETLDGVSSRLQSLGYEGISHKGGLLTNNPEHKVKIYWKPENLEIQEFSYPKDFKKISKIANESAKPRNFDQERIDYLEFLEEKGEAFKKEKLKEFTKSVKELEKKIELTRSGKNPGYDLDKLQIVLEFRKRTLESIKESLDKKPQSPKT